MAIKVDALVIGQLDTRTILVATANCFVIKEKVKTAAGDAWVGKYYYTEVWDAIRGYARHKLRDPSVVQKLDGNLPDLIATVGRLENTIKDIGDKLASAWTLRIQDPVESHLFSNGA